MYARSTTISGDSAGIDQGIAFVTDDVMPTITAIDGCVGLSLVVDRDHGRIIATSSWETREAMDASRDQLAALRARGGEILGGSPEIQEWEVAVMHRDHPTHDGACCRITWGRPGDLDSMLEMWRSALLPEIESFEGFCSASMLVDRSSGEMCGTVTFDSRSAMDASRDAATRLRERATSEASTEILDVAEFDLVIAHLRVPELV